MPERTERRTRSDTILVTGYAKLPEAEGKSERLFFGLALEVDPVGDVIIDAECSCSFELGQRFLKDLVVGRSLTRDLSECIRDIQLRLGVPSQNAVVRSLQNAYNRYREFRLARGFVDRTPLAARAASAGSGGSGS